MENIFLVPSGTPELLSTHQMGRHTTWAVRGDVKRLEQAGPEGDVAPMTLQNVFVAPCGHEKGDQNRHHGHLALGELVDFLLGVQLKFVQQSLGVVHVRGRGGKHMKILKAENVYKSYGKVILQELGDLQVDQRLPAG